MACAPIRLRVGATPPSLINMDQSSHPKSSQQPGVEADGDPVVPCFVPPLVALLTDAEGRKGSPLTKEEVLTARDNAVCLGVPASAAAALSAARGYDDLSPESAWEEWLTYRGSSNPKE